jgi:hypothetical protein
MTDEATEGFTPLGPEGLKLALNERTNFNFNRPVKFRLEFRSGTYIEGTITPNNPLSVFHSGEDITAATITIEPDAVAPITLVDK